MIFVTVGHQTPFDRLVRAMDAWAAAGGGECFAQIGEGVYEPRHMRWQRFLSPAEFADAMERATLLVGHAGTGTILSALQLGKPVLVLPRRAAFGETRNDHQVATARRFREAGYVLVADQEAELPVRIRELEGAAVKTIGPHAQPGLIEAVRAFLQA